MPPMPPMPAPHPAGPRPRWDLFCRVIDNHGDLGVCWRLATRLVALGVDVRLWVDDAAALAWMAPQGQAGIRLMPWREPVEADEPPGEVVVEAFGCDPPAGFVARMAARRGQGQHAPGTVPRQPGSPAAPLWFNLEYLSAEPYVERSHGLRSPQSGGPGAGLDKWFFYPGFSARTGGLLRGPLPADAPGFDGPAWLAAQGWAPRPGALRVSLFGYAQPALPAQLQAWSAGPQPVDLLLTPGHATAQASAWLGRPLAVGDPALRGALRLIALPWLPQPDYDRLLAACSLNLVRGEDSLVRALWAGAPLLWQLYPQDDGAHAAKLDAFLGRALEGAPPDLAAALRRSFARWNGLTPEDGRAALDGVDPVAWAAQAARFQAAQAALLASRGDLAEQLWRAAHGPVAPG